MKLQERIKKYQEQHPSKSLAEAVQVTLADLAKDNDVGGFDEIVSIICKSVDGPSPTKPADLNAVIDKYAKALVAGAKSEGINISYTDALSRIPEAKDLYKSQPSKITDRETLILVEARKLVESGRARDLGDAISQLPPEIKRQYRS